MEQWGQNYGGGGRRRASLTVSESNSGSHRRGNPSRTAYAAAVRTMAGKITNGQGVKATPTSATAITISPMIVTLRLLTDGTLRRHRPVDVAIGCAGPWCPDPALGDIVNRRDARKWELSG